MTVSRVGRLAPACHAAALALGLVGTFLPVMSLLVFPATAGTGEVTIVYSLWEVTLPPELADGVADSLVFLMTKSGVTAGAPILALALLVLAAAGVFSLLAARGGGVWVRRARFTSALGAGAVAAAAGTCVAHVRALTEGYPESIRVEVPFQTGPGVAALTGAAVLAVVAAATTLWLNPPIEASPDGTDAIDTPPMGLRLPDDGPENPAR